MKNIYLLLSFVFCGCVTKQIQVDRAKQTGTWQTKIQVKDLKNNKTNIVSADFAAIKFDKMRSDITGPFGVSVATMILNKSKFLLSVHTQKKNYIGTANDQSLRTVLKAELNPKILYYLLFDDILPENQWDCNIDERKLPIDCKMKNGDFFIKWSERNGEMKRIFISHQNIEIQIYVKNYSTKVQNEADIFEYQAPENYTTINSN